MRNLIAEKYCIIPKALIKDNRLSPSARIFYMYLATLSSHDKFSLKTLAKILNVTPQKLERYYGELKQSGWITFDDKQGIVLEDVK